MCSPKHWDLSGIRPWESLDLQGRSWEVGASDSKINRHMVGVAYTNIHTYTIYVYIHTEVHRSVATSLELRAPCPKSCASGFTTLIAELLSVGCSSTAADRDLCTLFEPTIAARGPLHSPGATRTTQGAQKA